MKLLRFFMLASGALALIGGIGIFVYFIFIRPQDIDDGGTLISSHAFAEYDDSGAIALPSLQSPSTLQPRISFDYFSYGFVAGPVEVISTRANYRVWTRVLLEDNDGAILRAEDFAVDFTNSWKSGDAEGKGEYRGRPIDPVSAARMRVILLPDESDPDKPLGELRTNSGGLQNVTIAAYRDAVDVRAHHELGAEAPTWGLYAAGVGLLFLVIGAVLPSKS